MSVARVRQAMIGFSVAFAAFGFFRLKLRADISPVVLTGQLAQGTANGRFIALGRPAVNSSGTIVFTALLDVSGIQSAGIFQVSGGVLSPVALEGQSFPDTANSSFGGRLGDPAINNAGDIVFTSNYAAGAAVLQGIFLSSSGTLRKLLDTTQAAPGTGQTFSSFGRVQINDGGDIAFAASLSGSSGNPIFMMSAGSVRAVINTNEMNPSFSLNNRGEIAFVAQGGISLLSNGSVQTLVASGQAIPNSNLKVFAPPGAFVSVNDNGDVVFINNLPTGSGRSGALPTPNGIVRTRGGTLEKVVANGEPVPGIAGATFDSGNFLESEINKAGVVFTARKAGNGEVTDIIARSQDSGLSIVASGDQVVEGLGLLDFIGEPSFDSDQGRLVSFVANLGSIAGIFAATQTQYNLQLPQIADGIGSGGGWRTTFIIANRSTATASATVRFYDDNGAPMSLGIGGQQQSQYPISVPALGVAQFQTDGTSPLRTGWAMVQSPQSLSAIALFAFYDAAGNVVDEVGTPASTALRSSSVFVQSDGSTSTGIAIANPNTSTASVTLILRDSSSNELARSAFTIAPMGHLAKYAGELFPGLSSTGFVGKIEIVSTLPLAAITLRQRGQIFTSLPVIP